nr:GTP cyclohydrolase I [Pseudogemmobacter humi]
MVMESDHVCTHWPGLRRDQAVMTNSVMRGVFLPCPALRCEFFCLRRTGRG